MHLLILPQFSWANQTGGPSFSEQLTIERRRHPIHDFKELLHRQLLALLLLLQQLIPDVDRGMQVFFDQQLHPL